MLCMPALESVPTYLLWEKIVKPEHFYKLLMQEIICKFYWFRFQHWTASCGRQKAFSRCQTQQNDKFTWKLDRLKKFFWRLNGLAFVYFGHNSYWLSLQMTDKILLAPNNPWLKSGSIRDNITFGATQQNRASANRTRLYEKVSQVFHFSSFAKVFH